MPMRFCMIVTFAVFLLINATTSAHHSFAAEYFEDKTMTVTGQLVQFDYRAPHAWVHVRAVDEQNREQTYAAEWANPSRLTRDKVTKETLQPGDMLIVTGSPSRDPQNRRLHLKRVERPSDGWKWEGFRRR